MTNALVEAAGLFKNYTVGGETIHALQGISFSIKRAEFVAIVGRSGSGKSTLMSILGLLDRADLGSYTLNGSDVMGLEEDQRTAIRNQKIGFVFQNSALLARHTALENVEIPLFYAGCGIQERERRARAALDRVGLSHRKDHSPSQLSGGEQQRVAIARALVNNPVLILADEPTGALDSKTSESVMTLFDDLNREGRTIIIVTHDETVARRAKRRVTLSDGRIAKNKRQKNAR